MVCPFRVSDEDAKRGRCETGMRMRNGDGCETGTDAKRGRDHFGRMAI